MIDKLNDRKTALTTRLTQLTANHAQKLQELRSIENEANTVQGAIEALNLVLADVTAGDVTPGAAEAVNQTVDVVETK